MMITYTYSYLLQLGYYGVDIKLQEQKRCFIMNYDYKHTHLGVFVSLMETHPYIIC
jgi:hypothetical protein